MTTEEIYNQIVTEEEVILDKLKEAVLIHAMREYKEDVLCKAVVVEDLLDYMVRTRKISRTSLMARTRRREVTEARQIIWYLISKGITPIKFTLAAMGQLFGRDHCTALHGVRNIETVVQVDSNLRNEVMVMANAFGMSTSWDTEAKELSFV